MTPAAPGRLARYRRHAQGRSIALAVPAFLEVWGMGVGLAVLASAIVGVGIGLLFVIQSSSSGRLRGCGRGSVLAAGGFAGESSSTTSTFRS
jgi:hypothetical protein